MKNKRGIIFLLISVGILVGLLAVIPAYASGTFDFGDWVVSFAKREGTFSSGNTGILCDPPGQAIMGSVDEADFYLATLDETGTDPATGRKIIITGIQVTDPDTPDENFSKYFSWQITNGGKSAKIHVDREVGFEQICFNAFYNILETSGDLIDNDDLGFTILIAADTRTPVDLSGVRWDYSKAFDYDNTEKSVHLTGVPDEVEVKYTNNTATAAGKYTAGAELSIKEEKKAGYRLDRNIPDRITRLEWEIVFPANVKAVIDLINDLPAADKVTAADKEEIAAARAAYNALTENEKKLIDAATLKKLTDAEAALAALTAKINTKLSGSSLSAPYKSTKKLAVTLTDVNGNPLSGRTLSVALNGKINKLKTDSKGKIQVSVSSLVPKTYTATIKFAGDAQYNASSVSVKVIVTKASPSLSAAAKTYTLKAKTKKYTVTLKDPKKKPIKKAKITLKVNGKTYSATTNGKGTATFKLDKLTKAGTYKATIKYAGNKYYKPVSKTVNITVKKN